MLVALLGVVRCIDQPKPCAVAPAPAAQNVKDVAVLFHSATGENHGVRRPSLRATTLRNGPVEDRRAYQEC
jgi:hypothetical protein